MERPESRSSGLPRVSRLPQTRLPARPAAASQDSDIGPGITAGRPARSNTMELRQPASVRPAGQLAPMATPSKRQSMLVRPGFQTAPAREPPPEDRNPLQSPTSSMSPQSQHSDDASLSGPDSRFRAPPVAHPRRSRPSLSDRTMETLAQVPPSPSTRRLSGFYGNPSESPMRPPSRANSSLGYRPGSRLDSIPSSVRQPDRTASPSKRPVSMSNTALARPGSIALPKKTTNPTVQPSTGPTALQQPSKLQSRIGGRGTTPLKSSAPGPGAQSRFGGSRSMGIKSPTKSSAREVFGGPLRPASPQKPNGSTANTMQPPLKKLAAPKVIPRTGHRPTASIDSSRDGASSPEKPAMGSQGLRDAIAKAKASHRKQDSAFVPRLAAENNFASTGSDFDPNTLDVVNNVHFNILKKRIHNARTDGRLNISSLCLTEIPKDVLQMYEFDPDDKSSTPWYESVDVTRLLAGDNEIKELPSGLFPPGPLGDEMDEEEQSSCPFPNLEHLDLRGNLLEDLPANIGHLPALRHLDLTGNKLSGNSAWGALLSIKPLRDLKMGKNQMTGAIPDNISVLEELEHFEAHDNQFEEVPSSIGKLAKLKELILTGNRLQALPFEPIFDIGITRIELARNRLNGSLFPKTVPSFNSLVHLNVSHNALTHISESSISLPNLKTLDISNNRIIELPSVATWSRFETLLAEENKISAFPEGFAKCTTLQTVNLNNNSLLALDDDIGSMDSLVSLSIEHNPIRERKLMKLSTEELKAELRSRRAAEANTSSPRRFGTFAEAPTSPSTTAWTVAGGTVDRSNTRMISIDEATVQTVADKSVAALILHHNMLQTVSLSIELLGASLVTLDLANNKLGRSEHYLASQLCLPNLQTINLTSNALTSLAPLTLHLSAPRLATLTLPFNRLTALPSDLCRAFPALRKLMANNNKLTVLDVTAVRSLEVLDISSNDLEALPPQLGLLQGQMRMLMVGANKFRVPGWGVIEKGTEAILGWCRKQLPENATLESLNGET